MKDKIREILDTFGRMYEHSEQQGKDLEQATDKIMALMPSYKQIVNKLNAVQTESADDIDYGSIFNKQELAKALVSEWRDK